MKEAEERSKNLIGSVGKASSIQRVRVRGSLRVS